MTSTMITSTTKTVHGNSSTSTKVVVETCVGPSPGDKHEKREDVLRSAQCNNGTVKAEGNAVVAGMGVLTGAFAFAMLLI